MRKLTKAQQQAVKDLYRRSNDGTPSYLRFRRRVHYTFLGCAMIQWCGMWIGIEPDGYTHS